jgi:hypothetical protein
VLWLLDVGFAASRASSSRIACRIVSDFDFTKGRCASLGPNSLLLASMALLLDFRVLRQAIMLQRTHIVY